MSTGSVYHSSLVVGGAGTVSRGLLLVGVLRGFSLINSIFDAGDGFERRAVQMTNNPLTDGELFNWTRSVAVIEGKDPNDTWMWRDNSAETVADLEAALGRSGCVQTTEQAGFHDRAQGDFHLTEVSTSFLGQGDPIGPGGPTVDYDGFPRPVAAPSIGPFEYNP